MGCYPSKTHNSPTHGELNKEIKRNLMFRAGFNMGEQSYGIQIGFACVKAETFIPSGYENNHVLQEETPQLEDTTHE